MRYEPLVPYPEPSEFVRLCDDGHAEFHIMPGRLGLEPPVLWTFLNGLYIGAHDAFLSHE